MPLERGWKASSSRFSASSASRHLGCLLVGLLRHQTQLVKDRDVCALGQFDADGIRVARPCVILRHATAQIPRLHAHDGVKPRIEARSAVEHFQAQHLFLNARRAARQRFRNDVTQEPAQTW